MTSRSTNIAVLIMALSAIFLLWYDLTPTSIPIQAQPDHPPARITTTRNTTTIIHHTTAPTTSATTFTTTAPTASTTSIPINFTQNFTITSTSISTTTPTTTSNLTTTSINENAAANQSGGIAELVNAIVAGIYAFFKAVLTNF